MADADQHTCPVCQEQFDSEEALKEHGIEAHQDHDPETDETGPEGSGL